MSPLTPASNKPKQNQLRIERAVGIEVKLVSYIQTWLMKHMIYTSSPLRSEPGTQELVSAMQTRMVSPRLCAFSVHLRATRMSSQKSPKLSVLSPKPSPLISTLHGVRSECTSSWECKCMMPISMLQAMWRYSCGASERRAGRHQVRSVLSMYG